MTISPACQALVRGELQRRAPKRGMAKREAYAINVTQHSYLAYTAGRNPIPEAVAWRILEQARREDLELAAKIEAELRRPPLCKEKG